MPDGDIRDFIALLESRGQLHRVAAEVDPALEIAEITDRVSKQPDGGKALLFERVRGSAFPAATNLFGSPQRMRLALGGIYEQFHLPPDLREFAPVDVANPPCREVVERENPDLAIFPSLKLMPEDGSPFITLPLVFTKDPETGAQNCGMYRVQIHDGKAATIRWLPGSGGARHCEKYATRGERMPVAVAVGGPPALIVAACAPLPDEVDEIAFAGFMRGEAVETAKCLTCDLTVPANAELVIEGYVDPGETRLEGPFGNHTGYYSPAAPAPVFHVTCISHRRNAIIPATVVGRPPVEDCHMAEAVGRLMLPFLRREFPEIADLRFIREGIFHGCAALSVNGLSGGFEAFIRRVWSSDGILRRSKLLVVVNTDVDAADISCVTWRVFNNANWKRDVLIDETGGRMAVDATRKPDGRVEARMSEEMRAIVSARWEEYGFGVE
ncbi:MAG: UbiD family decarboxylase [Nitrospirae bacterium]|nr:UbiD family decarboxylase [Nitrospirota bacterium]